MNTNNGGIKTIKEASNLSGSGQIVVVYNLNATVWRLSSLRSKYGIRKLFHVLLNVNIDDVIIIGLLSGTIILVNIPKLLHPSMRDASI